MKPITGYNPRNKGQRRIGRYFSDIWLERIKETKPQRQMIAGRRAEIRWRGVQIQISCLSKQLDAVALIVTTRGEGSR